MKLCSRCGWILTDSFWRWFLFGERTGDYCALCRKRDRGVKL